MINGKESGNVAWRGPELDPLLSREILRKPSRNWRPNKDEC